MSDGPGGPIRLWAAAVWLTAWQLGAMAFAAVYPHGALLLASPLAVLARLMELLPTAAFWAAAGRSAAHIAGGFLLSCAAASALAALAWRHRRVRELLCPLVAAMKAVPVVCFIILILVLLSSRPLSPVIVTLMVFPPVYLNVLTGIAGADRQLLEMARVFRVPRRRQLWGIWLPAVLPPFRAAVSLAAGLAWKSGVAAEVIGISAGTIGEQLYAAKVYVRTADLFAWTLVIAVLAALLERLALKAVDVLAGKVGAV